MRLNFRSLGLGSVDLSRIGTFSSMDIFFAVSEIIEFSQRHAWLTESNTGLSEMSFRLRTLTRFVAPGVGIILFSIFLKSPLR